MGKPEPCSVSQSSYRGQALPRQNLRTKVLRSGMHYSRGCLSYEGEDYRRSTPRPERVGERNGKSKKGTFEQADLRSSRRYQQVGCTVSYDLRGDRLTLPISIKLSMEHENLALSKLCSDTN